MNYVYGVAHVKDFKDFPFVLEIESENVFDNVLNSYDINILVNCINQFSVPVDGYSRVVIPENLFDVIVTINRNDSMADIERVILNSGNRIEAIKNYRNQYDASLKEAKTVVEETFKKYEKNFNDSSNS